MNKLEPHYVDFNTAKWLKEKGFNEWCRCSYNPTTNILQEVSSQNSILPAITAPEQHQVVEWLLEKHGIFVWVAGYRDKTNKLTFDFYFDNQKLNEKSSKFFKTPQEAYSAAFDYIKENNLI
jgi:hypothetical protein